MSKNYRAELVGCFGNPIDENPTGVVEEAAFLEKGLNYRYLTVLVKAEDLGKAMDGALISPFPTRLPFCSILMSSRKLPRSSAQSIRS